MLTDFEKWEAVLQCDKEFDGKFLYGVITTGIFCKPSCMSKAPLKKNIIFFENDKQAEEFGLRPCKRCRPDLLTYKPIQKLLNEVKEIYDEYYYDQVGLASEIKKITVSQNHIIRLFHKNFGMTPTEYVNKLRIKKALSLLSDTDMNILDISISSGFGSLSNFYSSFRRQMKTTPSTYRKNTAR